MGPFLGDSGVILDHFWVDPGSVGVTWGSFWHRFRVVLCRFDLILRRLWALFGSFSSQFRPKTGHWEGV